MAAAATCRAEVSPMWQASDHNALRTRALSEDGNEAEWEREARARTRALRDESARTYRYDAPANRFAETMYSRYNTKLGLSTLFSPSSAYILLVIFSMGPLYSREYSRICISLYLHARSSRYQGALEVK